MKKFSDLLNESCVTSDVNQGNSINLGVSNHYTPVQNIVTNIRNLFAIIVPVVASVGEDGVSVKLNSSKFINKEEINKILYQPVWQSQSLSSYIMSQGLDLIKMINLGMYWVVYFSPRDIKQAMPGMEADPATFPCEGQIEEETEMFNFITESDDDEELKDLAKEKLSEIIQMKDKVKAAKQLELLVGTEMELPREYYFAGVKDKQGLESIALRWKYTVKRPKKMTAEATRSLINIYGLDKDGIWVSDFDDEAMFKLPDEVKKLVENILEFLGAEKTDDPCVWDLSGEKKDDSSSDDKPESEGEKNKNNGNREEKNDEKKDSSTESSDNKEDVEDDKSRDENDLL